MRLVPGIEDGRPVLRDPATGEALEAASRVLIDWTEGEPMQVSATWSVAPDDAAPSRPLGRADFLPEPEATPAPARDEDDDRPQNRRPL